MINSKKPVREYLTQARSSINYEEMTDKLTRQAALAKRMLLATRKFVIKNEDEKAILMIMYLFFYRALFLFPDDEIYGKFEELGINKSQIKWFLSLDELNQKFDKVEKSNIFVYRDIALYYINIYTSMQIFIEVYFWMGFFKVSSTGKKKPEFITDFEAAERRRKDNRTRQNKTGNVYKDYIFDVVVQLNEAEKRKGMLGLTGLKLLKGQPAKYLLNGFVNESFFYEKPDKTDDFFLSTIYDVCKFFLKNATMPSEDEVFKREIYIGKSLQGWKSMVLRNIIYGQG